MNRMWNARNPHQGDAPRILCVCSAGLLRSPTLANLLIAEGFNCRAVGSAKEFALIPVDVVLINWADLIVCCDRSSYNDVMEDYKDKIEEYGVKVLQLNIEDDYNYMDDMLVKILGWKIEWIKEEIKL